MPLRLFFMVLVCLPFVANSQRFAYQHYRQGNGLAAQQVRTVAKGQSGALWVGTDDGLFRFAGEDFISYNNLLESHYIRAFAQNKDGDLVFCSDTGVHQLIEEGDSARIEQLIPASFSPTDSALFYPNGLFYDPSGVLWLSQPDGRLGKWENSQLQFLQPGSAYQGPKGQARYCFAETRAGQLLLSDPQGQVFIYRNEEDGFEAISSPVEGGASALLMHAGQIWSGGDQLRHFIFRGDRWQLNQSIPVPHGRITVLKPTADPDRLLVGTDKEGIFLYNASADNWQVVFGSNDPHRIERLPLWHINDIVADRAGDWWVCSEEGLGLLQQPFFSTVFRQANNSTLSLAADDAGRVLVSYGEVYEMMPEGEGFSSERLPELEEGLITALAVTDRGTWFGSSRGELLRLYRDNLYVEANLQERGGGIFFVEADASDNIWICQAPDVSPIKGVARYHPTEGLSTYGPEAGLDNRILVLRQGPKLRVYAAGIGPDTYLYRYEAEKDRFLNLSLPLPFAASPAFEVHDMAIDEKGVVWLATTDGLLQYDLERIQRVELGTYTTDEIRSLTTGRDNQLWLATATNGLFYYETDRQQVTRLDESSGLPSIIAAYRSMLEDANGRIWVGTAEGVVYSKADGPIPEPSPTPHWLSQILNGEPIADDIALRINPNDQLKLSWTTTAFSAGPIQYRYRLQGATDSSWVELREHTNVELPLLSPGNYEVQVQSLQSGGYQWSKPLRLGLEVRKPWYERWWGLGLLLLGGVLLSTALFRSTIGALRLRLRALNRQVSRLREEKKMYQEQEVSLQTTAAQYQQQLTDLERQLAIYQQLSKEGIKGEPPSVILERIAGHLLHLFRAELVELAWLENDQIIREGYWKTPSTYLSKKQPAVDWAWTNLSNDAPVAGQGESGYPIDLFQSEPGLELTYLLMALSPASGQRCYLLLYRNTEEAFSENDQRMLRLVGQYLEMQLASSLKK